MNRKSLQHHFRKRCKECHYSIEVSMRAAVYWHMIAFLNKQGKQDLDLFPLVEEIGLDWTPEKIQDTWLAVTKIINGMSDESMTIFYSHILNPTLEITLQGFRI